MSAEETSKTESAPASKEDSKPVTQAISAKQKQVVVSSLDGSGSIANHLNTSCSNQ